MPKITIRIFFSTEYALDRGEFFLSDWGNDNPIEIKSSAGLSLAAGIVEISNYNGVNTSENECQFDYKFTQEDEDIIESWSNELELDILLNDKESYEEKQHITPHCRILKMGNCRYSSGRVTKHIKMGNLFKNM